METLTWAMQNLTLVTGATILVGTIIFLFLLNTFVPVGLWITAYFSGVKVSLGTMIGMRLRKVAPRRIINPLINATKAGLSIGIFDGERVDVVTEGDYIDAQASIEIVKDEGYRVIVRQLSQPN